MPSLDGRLRSCAMSRARASMPISFRLEKFFVLERIFSDEHGNYTEGLRAQPAGLRPCAVNARRLRAVPPLKD